MVIFMLIMVWQQEAPPVPTRTDELMMIAKIKKSMQDQPYTKYYMNEGLRLSKMDLGNEIKAHRKDWFGNFLRGALVGGIVISPFVVNMFRYSAHGVPSYNIVGRHNLPWYRNYLGTRKSKQAVVFIAGATTLGYIYASIRTSAVPFTDEYMNKRKIRLPY